MVSRRNADVSTEIKEGASNSGSTAAVNGGKTAEKSTKRRQTSIRNFFGNAAVAAKKTTSLQDNPKKTKPLGFSPLTPPTPISPRTPLTPPTEQAPAVATPPSPFGADSVAVIFKKAKRDTTPSKTQTNASSITSSNGTQKKALEQTYLDFGQENFGKRTICKTCGMLYVHGLNEDSKQHSRICMDYMEGVPFTISKARVVSSESKGSIVEVCADNGKVGPTV
jgi:hypothetical protein